MSRIGVRTVRWAAVCAVLALAGGALPAAAAAAQNEAVAAVAPVAAAPGHERVAVTAHVVIISVDGLRPDAITRYAVETIGRLMREGSYSLHARTILPSTTLPSHTSMLTGQPPAVHGVTWNDDTGRGTLRVPTVFALAHERGLRTAAFFSKSKFQQLEPPGSLHYARGPTRGDGLWSAGRTAREVERYLRRARPNLLFVHIADADLAGHTWGWMGLLYGRAVRSADRAVKDVLATADRTFGPGGYTVILTADHGGHGRSHGTDDPRDTEIPWIIWGAGVRPGATLERDPQTMDTAATALWLLAVPVPADWAGIPVTAPLAKE